MLSFWFHQIDQRAFHTQARHSASFDHSSSASSIIKFRLFYLNWLLSKTSFELSLHYRTRSCCKTNSGQLSSLQIENDSLAVRRTTSESSSVACWTNIFQFIILLFKSEPEKLATLRCNLTIMMRWYAFSGNWVQFDAHCNISVALSCLFFLSFFIFIVLTLFLSFHLLIDSLPWFSVFCI